MLNSTQLFRNFVARYARPKKLCPPYTRFKFVPRYARRLLAASQIASFARNVLALNLCLAALGTFTDCLLRTYKQVRLNRFEFVPR